MQTVNIKHVMPPTRRPDLTNSQFAWGAMTGEQQIQEVRRQRMSVDESVAPSYSPQQMAMAQQQQAQYRTQVSQGYLLAQMMQTPGYQVLKQIAQQQIARAKAQKGPGPFTGVDTLLVYLGASMLEDSLNELFVAAESAAQATGEYE